MLRVSRASLTPRVTQVVTGLNLSVVSRLKEVWDAVGKRKCEQLRTLSDVMSPVGGYAAYRRELAKVENTGQASIPFQAVYLSNLVAMEENPTFKSSGHINFAKMWMVGRVFQSVLAQQRKSYDDTLKQRPEVAKFFRGIAKLNDDELWQLSLQIQPRQSSSTSALDDTDSNADEVRASYPSTSRIALTNSSGCAHRVPPRRSCRLPSG